MDIHDVSLYCVVYPVAKTKGIIGVWQNTGIGMLTRPAQELLKYVDMGLRKWCGLVTLRNIPTQTDHSEAHGKLRKRISDLLHKTPLDLEKVKIEPDDVYLFQTGMAAIHRLDQSVVERCTGTILCSDQYSLPPGTYSMKDQVA